jgi:hypothetical protein
MGAKLHVLSLDAVETNSRLAAVREALATGEELLPKSPLGANFRLADDTVLRDPSALSAAFAILPG